MTRYYQRQDDFFWGFQSWDRKGDPWVVVQTVSYPRVFHKLFACLLGE